MPMTRVRIWPTIRMTPFYYPIQCTWAKFWIYIIEDFTEHYMYSNLWKWCRAGITSFNLSLSYIFSWTYHYSIHDFKWEFAPAFRFCFKSQTTTGPSLFPRLGQASIEEVCGAWRLRWDFGSRNGENLNHPLWYGYMDIWYMDDPMKVDDDWGYPDFRKPP
jgi:hypothetical protein